MKAIGIYEVKTKISEICETVKKTHEPVIITKRGVPMVKISSIDSKKEQSDVWGKYYTYTEANSPILEEIVLPSRDVDPLKNTLDD
ncbi:MAG: type II toxin-antitoxin system Phd/YefM family antitoxin [Candidatus Brocadiales bacterium]|nr:type II toxin-antitoxin system Phd/YefM family antitoxin [Candidatus Brocadiales bacterium]